MIAASNRKASNCGQIDSPGARFGEDNGETVGVVRPVCHNSLTYLPLGISS